jgi:AcrR family transcriptional regulator
MSATSDPPLPAPKGRRPPGQVQQGLIDAGIEFARHGGPDAVVLREATRHVGVAPNAAYRRAEDRDALLNAVCAPAMRILAQRMEERIALVPHRYGTKIGARARLVWAGVHGMAMLLELSALLRTFILRRL